MGRAFSEELDRLAQTLSWSGSVELPRVCPSEQASALSIVIGSGGSFTVATALAAHESRPEAGFAHAMTPLQYVQRADALPRHDVLLISAEGRNRDILHAADKALSIAANCAALTFSRVSPLTAAIDQKDAARLFCFDPPWGKDGYLATNSLLASIVLGFRMHGVSVDGRLLSAFLGLYRGANILDQLAAEVAKTRRLLSLHGTYGLIAAIDLESKLAEAAFAFTQVSDLRQFAHGRHIQLGEASAPVPVIAFISPHEGELWRATRAELPDHVTVQECALPGSQTDAAIAGLLIVMALVEKVGAVLHKDPGQPAVPEFARRIHALDPSKLLPMSLGRSDNPKIATLEAAFSHDAAIQAGARYIERLRQARFAALVLDFDGTMCETSRRNDGLDERLAPTVINLLQSGLTIAYASGRGDSLYKDLRSRLPPEFWPRCLLGCYSASLVISLDQPWPVTASDPQLDAIQRQLENLGIRQEHGFKLSSRVAQLTIRNSKGDGVDVLFTLCSSIVDGLAGWRVFRSAHSVDILTPAATKRAVVDKLVHQLRVNPLTEVFRIGDRGEPQGNDCELLSEGLGLSVDGVSGDPQSCWFFGAPTLGPVERAAHYLGSLLVEDGWAQFDEGVLRIWQERLA
jgi:hypothetical protein